MLLSLLINNIIAKTIRSLDYRKLMIFTNLVIDEIYTKYEVSTNDLNSRNFEMWKLYNNL